MRTVREQYRSGLDCLKAATALLQRVRNAHPTKGLYEAADLQWWWRTARSTDHLPQLFWVDHLGRPEAAVIATRNGKTIQVEQQKRLTAVVEDIQVIATDEQHAEDRQSGGAHRMAGTHSRQPGRFSQRPVP